MRVLITRAEPAAGRTASRLKISGFSPVCLPLFKIEPLNVALPRKDYHGYIFTSSNAIDALGGMGWSNENPDANCFCVGETTAKSAEQAGFSKLVIADGGGGSLANIIRSDYMQTGLRLLFPTTPDRLFDMKSALPKAIVDEVHVYQAGKIPLNQSQVSDALKHCAGGAVCSYSARSAACLDTLISRYALTELSRKISHVAISKAASDKIDPSNWKDISCSLRPNESSMIEQLKSVADSC